MPGEMYRMPDEVWARVEAGEPPNLYKGPVKLSDGRVVDGILYPRELAEGHHRDISEYGGWRAYGPPARRSAEPRGTPCSDARGPRWRQHGTARQRY